jgi:hypothetical protein
VWLQNEVPGGSLEVGGKIRKKDEYMFPLIATPL